MNRLQSVCGLETHFLVIAPRIGAISLVDHWRRQRRFERASPLAEGLMSSFMIAAFFMYRPNLRSSSIVWKGRKKSRLANNSMYPSCLARFTTSPRQDVRVDVRALEPLVPVAFVIEDAALQILMP